MQQRQIAARSARSKSSGRRGKLVFSAVLLPDIKLKFNLFLRTQAPFKTTQFKMSDSEEDREISFTVKVTTGGSVLKYILVI